MRCYESVDGLPLAAVTVRRFKLLLKRIWVKVMFYNVLSHMRYFQASSLLHWFLVKCLIASWMQYNSVLLANMVYISKWYTAPACPEQVWDFSSGVKKWKVGGGGGVCGWTCESGECFRGWTACTSFEHTHHRQFHPRLPQSPSAPRCLIKYISRN